MTASRVRRAATALFVAALVGVLTVPAGAEKPASPPATAGTRPVMFVGNNWDGTADVIDARTHEHLRRIDTIPDRHERMVEIFTSPDRLAFYLAIRTLVGEGHDQYTDDMFTTHDGRHVLVSRPSFADVVSISLESGEIAWRFPMEGYRSDHMDISPDGTTGVRRPTSSTRSTPPPARRSASSRPGTHPTRTPTRPTATG